ncbi:MAG: PAS domain S-box protein [Alphaproteobacteria bacterium]|nr:PAS domain S-box protein [Alphaproteobacteria bacterium]
MRAPKRGQWFARRDNRVTMSTRTGPTSSAPKGEPGLELARLRARIAELETRLAATERLAAALHDGPNRYRALVDASPDAIMIHDAGRRILYLNPAGLHQFGIPALALAVGRHGDDFVHPESRTVVASRSRQVLAGAVQSFLEQRRLRADGSAYWASVAAAPIDWDGLQASMCILRDTTAQRDEIDRVRIADRRLRDAIEAMSEGFALYDADERLVLCNQRYLNEIWPCVANLIVPGARFEDLVRAVLGRVGQFPPEDHDALVARALAQHRAPSSDFVLDDPAGRSIRQIKRRTSDGGTVCVYADVTAERRREAALADGEARYRRLFETLPDAVSIQVDGIIVHANSAMAALVGAESAAALIGTVVLDFVPLEQRAAHRQRIVRLHADGLAQPPVEQQRLRLDGTRVDVELRSALTIWDGRPAVLGVLRDITDRRRALAALREAEARYHAVVDTIPDPVLIVTGEVFAYANSAAALLFAAPDAAALVGRRALDFVPEALRETVRRRVDQVMTLLEPAAPDIQERVRLDGTRVEVETRVAPITWNGEPARVIVLRDVTERLADARALEESRRRFLAISTNLPGAVYQRVQHPDGRIEYPFVSDGVRHTHGFEAAEVTANPLRFVEAVHPDDRAMFREALARSKCDLAPFDVQIRNITPQGDTVWIHSIARPSRRADGAVVWDGLFVDITRQKEAEASAAQANQWLMDAIRSLSDGLVLWDPNDRLVLWNDKFLAEHKPLQAELARGMPYAEIARAAARSIYGLSAPALVEAYVARRVAERRTPRGPQEQRRADGTWVQLAEHRTREGFLVGIYTEITERKRYEERLRASEETSKTLINAAFDAALLSERDGTIVMANEAFAADVGLPLADLIGRKVASVTYAEGADERGRAAARAIETGVPVQFEQRFADGSWRLYLNSPVRDASGKVSRLARFSRDITRQRNAEENMRLAKEAAEIANRSKSEFLANMSHELRTPLNAIIGFSEMMVSEIFGVLGSENYRAYVRDIHDSGRHLLQVINDILDLSKIEAGKLAPSIALVDVRQTIEASLRLVKPRADGQGITLSARIGDGLGAVEADERMLKQVLMNLLSNAVKFTPAGGCVGVRARRVRDGVAITVVDTGIGIAAADIPRVMQPFSQVDSTLSRKYDGTGLGLPLTKSLVELQRDRFVLRSRPGLGTVASVIFAG